MYDADHPFPFKLPPELLRTRMADVPFKMPRRRLADRNGARPPIRAVP
jgi:hypothetical protein